MSTTTPPLRSPRRDDRESIKRLLDACKDWQRGQDVVHFAKVVSAAEAVLSTQTEWLKLFGVSEGTKSRWATGVALPHPLLQRMVVGDLQKIAWSRLYLPEQLRPLLESFLLAVDDLGARLGGMLIRGARGGRPRSRGH
jgi:hypothetical protein